MNKKPLSVSIFGTERSVGDIDAALHTDVRTIILGLMRQIDDRGSKPITLAEDRAAKVDEALRRGGTFEGGTAALAAAIASWKLDLRADGKAMRAAA